MFGDPIGIQSTKGPKAINPKHQIFPMKPKTRKNNKNWTLKFTNWIEKEKVIWTKANLHDFGFQMLIFQLPSGKVT